MTGIQSLLFKKTDYTVRQANAFLKRNNFEKLKPFHITNKYIRARLLPVDNKKHDYRKGSITKDIDCIFEF